MSRFVITCHGWSGSNWLAHILNQHPDIICTHSARCILPEAKDVNSDEELKRNIQDLHTGYLSRTELSLEEAYRNIESHGKASSYGSVHYYRLRDLPYQSEKFGNWDSPIPVINIIRDPVAVILSGSGHFQTLFTYDLNEFSWSLNRFLRTNQDRWRQLVSEKDVEVGRLGNLSFLCACAVSESLHKDMAVDTCSLNRKHFDFRGHVRIEDLFHSDESLRDLISAISPEVEVGEPYLKAVRDAGVINAHAKDEREAPIADRFAALESWKQEMLHYYLSHFGLIAFYESLGYTFDYLGSLPESQSVPQA